MSVTQVEGMNVVFECLYPNATAYGWAFNGTQLSFLPSDVGTNPSSGGSPASLTIPAKPQYNNTVVHCEAVGEGIGNIRSESATLKVQGTCTCILCIISGIAMDIKRVVVNGESHKACMQAII